MILVNKKTEIVIKFLDVDHDEVTLTYKRFDDLSLSGAKELETSVSDFEQTYKILEVSGLSKASYQESKRETWQLGDVEIMLDLWPWLPPYIEIEGPSEAVVKEVSVALGFDWDSAAFGDATVAYEAAHPEMEPNLGQNIGRLGDISFPTLCRLSYARCCL